MNIENLIKDVENADIVDEAIWNACLSEAMESIRDGETHPEIIAFTYLKAGIERLRRHMVVGERGVIDKTTESRDKIKADTLKGLYAVKEMMS